MHTHTQASEALVARTNAASNEAERDLIIQQAAQDMVQETAPMKKGKGKRRWKKKGK